MKFERPLKEKELNILDLQLDQLTNKRRNQIKFLIIWTSLALIIGSIAYFNTDPQKIIVLLLTIAAYIGVGIWVVTEQRIKEKRKRNSIAYLKNKNLVTVVEVNSDSFYL